MIVLTEVPINVQLTKLQEVYINNTLTMKYV